MRFNKAKLQVNSATGQQVQVNIRTQVNSQTIRTENYNGRDHIVLPSYTLPANVVMNGGLYPASEIDAHFNSLEGTLAPLGHPTLDGAHVSAFDAVAINAHHIGAWNRNVKKSGDRIYVEKWVDIEVAKSTEGGREFLARVEAITRGDDVPPIHTSVAAFIDQVPAAGENLGYAWTAKIHTFDHDAILLNEVGAATPEKGVGLMVNTADAKPIKVNSGVLTGESYGDKRHALESAATETFVQNPAEQFCWVADFTDTQAIIVRNGGTGDVFGYKIESGKVIFDLTGTPVERRETWIMKLNRLVKSPWGITPNLQKDETPMALTIEDKQEIATAVSAAMAAALKPTTDALATLEANQTKLQETLTANSRAAETDLRAKVAAKFGDVVANALAGDALAAMAVKCDEAAVLAGNAKAPAKDGAPDFSQVID